MSTLNVDALVGVSSANAITVRGEGSATTSLQQGLCKAWNRFDGTAITTIADSFNNSFILALMGTSKTPDFLGSLCILSNCVFKS